MSRKPTGKVALEIRKCKCGCGRMFETSWTGRKREYYSRTCSKKTQKKAKPYLWRRSLARYDARHPGLRSLRSKNWRAKNRDRVRCIKREYEKRPDVHAKKMARLKDWASRNRDKTRAWIRRWRQQVEYLTFLWRLENVTALLDHATSRNESADLDLNSVRDEVSKLSTEELRKQFADGMRLSKVYLLRTSAILVELESRGERLEGDQRFFNMLRKIGSGETLVDVVVKFSARPVTMTMIANMPVDEQRKFLSMGVGEADEKLRKRKKARASFSGGRAMVGGNLPALANLTKSATAQDAAEMCMEIVKANENPLDCATRLQKLLREFVASQIRPKPKKATSGT